MARKKSKIALGIKYFWLNWLSRDSQVNALRFLNKATVQRKTVSFNNYVHSFKKVLLILPEAPYEVILAQRAIMALKEHRPDMKVDVVAEAVNKDVIKSNPYIDQGIFYSNSEFFYNHPAFKELVTVIRENRYDACFLMQEEPGPLELFLAASSECMLRIGFADKNISPFINLSIRPKEGTEYVGDKYEALLKTLGIKLAKSKPKWDIPKATEKDVEGVLVEAGYRIEQSLIGLNVSSSILGRTLPASAVKELIAELSKIGNAEILLFYSSREETTLIKELEGLKKNIIPIPEDQISFAAAFVYKCDIIISLNNIIYQLAVMLGRPVIGVFEENENKRWALCQSNKYEVVSAPRVKEINILEITEKAAKMLAQR